MNKPTIQSIHKQHQTFDDDFKIGIIQQYNRDIKRWKFVGYSCLHCSNGFKSPVTITKHMNNCKELNTSKKTKESEMPIQTIMIKGERYYRYGDSGKPYKNRSDAEKQAQAIHASGYKEPKKDIKQK